MIMTPEKFRNDVIGKSFDVDHAYGPQCWDLFAYMLYSLRIPVSAYCALTGYVCDLWRLRWQYLYSDYFDFIERPDDLNTGDWAIWDRGSASHPSSHIAMYYHGEELGQNQGYPYVTEKETDFSDMLGALRPKFWDIPEKGYAEFFDTKYAGRYTCTHPLNLRAGGDTSYVSYTVMLRGSEVICYGYYHEDARGRIWLYVTYKNLTGFACMDYLKK